MKKFALIFLFVLITIMITACGGNTTTKLETTALTTTYMPTTEKPTTIPTTDDYTTDVNFQGEFPNGLFDLYDDWDNPIRKIFYDAKAEYALNHLVMGVPIYRDSLAVNYFSDRVALQLDSYDEHLKFNEFESTLLASDEERTMLNGNLGKSDEYTFRVVTDTLDNDWNHLDSANREELLARYNEAPYKWVLTDDGKKLISNYFIDDPVMSDINPEKSVVLQAKEFEFTLKDNLEWQYNSLTDTSSFPMGHEKIDAEDFVYTYKYALRRYFRASSPLRRYGILYANEYHDSIFEYEDSVGIQVVDDLKFKLTFENYISLDLVKKMLSEVRLAPINSVMHEELGELYADDIYSICYSGNYYIEEASANYVKLLPNPKHINSHSMFTAIEFKFDFVNDNIFNDFNNGLYDMISLDSYSLEDSFDIDDGLLRPNNSFKTIAFNGQSNTQYDQSLSISSQNEYEPIISSEIFQKALYYAINREDITENIVDYKLPLADYMDDEIDFFGDFHRDVAGYAPELAVSYFHLALEQMGEIYQFGDTITLTLAYEIADKDLALYLEENLEDVLNDRSLEIRVDIQLLEVAGDFLQEVANYYPYVQYFYPDQKFIDSAKKEYDLFLTDGFLDESFMFQTKNYNRQLSGTNNPEIELNYTLSEFDDQGQVLNTEEVNELWSFIAIQELYRLEPAIITDGKALEETAVEVVEITPFGFSMLLPYYSSDVFEKIEFEVRKLNYALDIYDYEYERQTLLTDEINISDDQANVYVVKIWFELKYYPGIVKEREFVVLLPLLVDEITVTGTSASITLNTSDRERVFLVDSALVYERNGNELVGSVEYLGDELIITGLVAGKEYVVKFLTDDDYSTEAAIDYIFKARFFT